MKIAVFGGTGAMGMHLCNILAMDPHNRIVVTSRNPPQKKESSGRVTYVKGDAHNTDFIESFLAEKWDVVVDFMIYSTSEFKERIEVLLANTGQYVFLSSARVYADASGLLTEKSPRLLDTSSDQNYLKTDEYALAKARQEDILKNQSKKNWTIIRPYITFGEQRLQLGVLEKESWLYRALHGRTIVFSDDIASKETTLTYGYDVAAGIASVLGRPEALGETFHITQLKSYRWQDYLNIYLDVLEECLGRRPAVCMTTNCLRIKKPAMRYQVIYDRQYDRKFDDTKIGRYTDLSLFSDPKAKIAECVRTCIQKPHFQPVDWAEEAEFDRLVHECAHCSEFSSKKQYLKYILLRFFPALAILLKNIKHFAGRLK